MTLPAELWKYIIGTAVHVPELFYTSWDSDPDVAIWEGWEGWEDTERFPNDFEMKTKLAVVQVCRTWKELGIEFLYEAISIPYRGWSKDPYGKLRHLVDVLKASASPGEFGGTAAARFGYGWWTKRIACTSVLLLSPDVKYLFALLQHCYNLRIFVVLSGVHVPNTMFHELGQALQSRFTHSLRRVDFRPASGATGAFPLTGTDHPSSPTLSLTSFHIRIRDPRHDFPLLSSLENITTLTIGLLSLIEHPLPWHFPRLRALGLMSLGTGHFQLLQPFVERHHSTLHQLFIQANGASASDLPLFLPNDSRIWSLVFDDQDLEAVAGLVQEGGDLPCLARMSHLGLVFTSMSDSPERIRDSMGSLFKSGSFPCLKVMRVLSVMSPALSEPDVWTDLVETCRAHGTRVEDLHGESLMVWNEVIPITQS